GIRPFQNPPPGTEFTMLADDSIVVPLIVFLVIVAFLAACVVVGINACIVAIAGWFDKGAKEKQEREEEALRQKELALYDQTRQTIAESLRQSRELAIQHYQSKIPAGTAKELEQRLKDSHQMFTRTGKVLSIRVVGVPTGWI